MRLRTMMGKALVGFLLTVTATLTPVLSAAADNARHAELNRLLEYTLLVANTSRRNVEPDTPWFSTEDEEEIEIELELAHAELSGGYFQNICVYKPDEVLGMRMISMYVKVLRLVGYTDIEITASLIEHAGDDAPRVAQLLDFAGLDGMEHFICRDYMQAMLAIGMSATELRHYINAQSDTTDNATKMASMSNN